MTIQMKMSFNPEKKKSAQEVMFSCFLALNQISTLNNLPIVKTASQNTLTFNSRINEKLDKAMKGLLMVCYLTFNIFYDLLACYLQILH